MSDLPILLSICSHNLYLQHGGCYDNDADDVSVPHASVTRLPLLYVGLRLVPSYLVRSKFDDRPGYNIIWRLPLCILVFVNFYLAALHWAKMMRFH